MGSSQDNDPFLTIQINSDQDWEYIEEKEPSTSVNEEDQTFSPPAGPPEGSADVSGQLQGRVHKKKARFTPEELAIVVEELSTHNKLLFTIHQDPAKTQCKAAKWADILRRVNAHQVTFRTIDDIKKRWHDLRKTARKKLLKIRREEAKGAGGSPSKKTRLTRLEKMAAKTMTPKTSYFFSRREVALDDEQVPSSSQSSPMVKDIGDSYGAKQEESPLQSIQVGTSRVHRRGNHKWVEKNSEASTSCHSSYSEDMFNHKMQRFSENATTPVQHQSAQEAQARSPDDNCVLIKTEDEWECTEEQEELQEDRNMGNYQVHSWAAPPVEPAPASRRWQIKPHKRKARFAPAELAILAEELSTHNKLLFRAQHNLADVQRKAHKWADVLRQVNAISITHRTIGDIKRRWHKLRRTTKKKLLQIRRETQERGVEETQLTPFEELAARTMTPQMIYGIFEGLDTLESDEETQHLEQPPMHQELEEVAAAGDMRHDVSCEEEETSHKEVESRSSQSSLKRVSITSTNSHTVTLEDMERHVSEIITPAIQAASPGRPPTPPLQGHKSEAIAEQTDLLAHQVGQLVETLREQNDLLRGHRGNELLMERRMACLENAVLTMVQTNHALIQAQAQQTQEIGNLTQTVRLLVEHIDASRPGPVPCNTYPDPVSRTSLSLLPPRSALNYPPFPL
ncbi:uncharacterized protein WCC33_015973 [Rhinophrynus dorsalis]